MSNADLPKNSPEAASPLTGNSTIGGRPVEQPTADQLAMTGHHPRTADSILPVDYLPGTVFGSYQLQEKLGEGGMGAVFKATHLKLKKVMALKILPVEKLRGPESVARFEREMEAVGRVEHPNIVQAYDAGEVNGIHFISMNYIEGSDLSQLVRKKGTLSVTSASKAVRSAALGLAAAHNAGLVHRDIKPSNLLADKQGKIHILDLGLALLGDAQSANRTELTAAGTCFGTPDYMAPEQWDDSHSVDARSDLYALGCTLHFLLVGRAPYETDDFKTMIGKMRAHLDRPIPDLKAARPTLPEGLVAIYTRLMAKRPEDRIQTANELADALEPYTKKSKSTDDLPDLGERSGASHRSGGSAGGSGISAGAARPIKGDSIFNDGEQSYNQTVSLSRSDLLPDPLSTAPATQQISITLTPTSASRATTNPSVPRKPFPKPWLLAGAAVFVLLMLAGIIIKITQKDGSVTEIPVPKGAKVEVTTTKKRKIASNAANKTIENQKSKIENAVAPFDAATALKHQEAWAAYLKVPVEYTNSIGIKFRLIPPGEFLMGSTPEEIDAALKEAWDDKNAQEWIKAEGPRHKVVLTQAIYLSVYEVTQKEWGHVMKTNPSHFSPMGMGKEAVATLETAQHPVEMVSWQEAAEYCSKLSQQEQLKPFYFRAGETVTPLDGTGYRLPTEAEWEFACRAGTTSKYWIGDTDDDLLRAGWYGTNSGGRTHAVGELNANPFGLFDVHGNVYEWVQDTYDPAYYGQFAEKIAVDPAGPISQGTDWVLRGGNWHFGALACRAAIRHRRPGDHDYNLGFRLALTVDAVKQLQKPESKPATVASSTTGWHGWPADAPPPAIAPFDAAQALKHQEAWAAYLKVPVEYTNSIGMKFRLIPPGEFMMGATKDEIEYMIKGLINPADPWQEVARSAGPLHKVILTHPYYLGRHEVTQSQFANVMGRNPSRFAAKGADPELAAKVVALDTANHPVEWVTWNDSAEFLSKLSEKEQLKPNYFRAGETITALKGTGYRFPSDAQWEFACRAGTSSRFSFGDREDELFKSEWVSGNSDARTHPVGELQDNPFGLFDIHGNVAEYVGDGWDANYFQQFATTPAVDPAGPDASQRLWRGGDWHYSAAFCIVPSRYSGNASQGGPMLGIRAALTIEGVRELLKQTPETTAGWHGWPADAVPPAIAPFDAAQALKHQEAWAAYLKVPVEFTNSIGMKFRLIPPGEFMMGSTPEEIEAVLKLAAEDKNWQEWIKSEGPRHKVVLTQAVYLSVSEVTQEEWEAVMKTNPSHFAATGMGKEAVANLETGMHPVEMVSWNDAAEYCSKLSQQEQLKPFYFRGGETVTPLDGTGYRLPTEAEWEFACRAGTASKYWIGDTDDDLLRAGWYGANSGARTHAVGELKANPFGLHDIHGNVYEWVQDWYDPAYYGQVAGKNTVDPSGPFSLGSYRMGRGGGWGVDAAYCRPAARRSYGPTYRTNDIGFRLALSPSGQTTERPDR